MIKFRPMSRSRGFNILPTIQTLLPATFRALTPMILGDLSRFPSNPAYSRLHVTVPPEEYLKLARAIAASALKHPEEEGARSFPFLSSTSLVWTPVQDFSLLPFPFFLVFSFLLAGYRLRHHPPIPDASQLLRIDCRSARQELPRFPRPLSPEPHHHQPQQGSHLSPLVVGFGLQTRQAARPIRPETLCVRLRPTHFGVSPAQDPVRLNAADFPLAYSLLDGEQDARSPCTSQSDRVDARRVRVLRLRPGRARGYRPPALLQALELCESRTTGMF